MEHEADDYYAELRVLFIRQLGDAASVALAFGTEWSDFHNLLRSTASGRSPTKRPPTRADDYGAQT